MQDRRWLTMHRFRAIIFSMNEFKTISRTLFASEFLISTLLPDFHHVEVVFWKILFFFGFLFSFLDFFFKHFWFFNFFVLSFCFFNDVFHFLISKLLTLTFCLKNLVLPFETCLAKIQVTSKAYIHSAFTTLVARFLSFSSAILNQPFWI